MSPFWVVAYPYIKRNKCQKVRVFFVWGWETGEGGASIEPFLSFVPYLSLIELQIVEKSVPWWNWHDTKYSCDAILMK